MTAMVDKPGSSICSDRIPPQGTQHYCNIKKNFKSTKELNFYFLPPQIRKQLRKNQFMLHAF